MVITSISRIIFPAKLDNADPTWSSAPIQLWSSLENAAGVMNACIPSIMPLVLCMMGRKAHPHDRRASYFNHKGGESSSESNGKKKKFNRLDETNQFSIVENVELSQATLTRIPMTARGLSSTASNDPIQPSPTGTTWK